MPELPEPRATLRDAPAPEPPDNRKPAPALVGRDLPFPIKLIPLTSDDGKYNRPNFLNYYFGKTDLVKGPEDPSSFFDEFFLEAQDPATKHRWTYEYTVASPSGLQSVMSEERFASLYFDGPLVIVPRWDIEMILHTVTEEIIKHYGETDEPIEPKIATISGDATPTGQ